MVESFMGRDEARPSRQVSEVDGPCVQMKSITACSTSPKFFGRGWRVLVIVALQYVTYENVGVKANLGK